MAACGWGPDGVPVTRRGAGSLPRRRGASGAAAVLLGVLVACGVTAEDQRRARDDVTSRGFTATAVSVQPGSDHVVVDVVFGEKGCVGRVEWRGGDPLETDLVVEVVVPGSRDGTTTARMDDPTVERLRGVPPFAEACFG